MKNIVLKIRILFILDYICIALGVFMLGLGIALGVAVLGFGIFFMGFWTFIIVVNPELKDWGEERWRSGRI